MFAVPSLKLAPPASPLEFEVMIALVFERHSFAV
jgi:hypothetical protein